MPTAPARAIATTVLVAFIVITQAPRPGETPFLTAADDITLTLAAVNRFEQAEPAYGAGYDDEFLPRWADLAALQSPAPPLPGGDAREMLEFETLTWAPIDRRLIDAEALNPDERAWIDAYHARTADILRPLLPHDVADWLERATAPL